MKLASIDRISVLNIHYINYSLDYFLDCQQALGVKNVELLAGRQDMWLDHKGSIDPKIIKKKLDDRGLKCPVITPDNCMLGYQFAAKEPELRERSYNYFVKCFDPRQCLVHCIQHLHLAGSDFLSQLYRCQTHQSHGRASYSTVFGTL